MSLPLVQPEAVSWPTVAMSAVGLLQTVGMGWLANHFRKNRRAGRERDAVVYDTAKRSEDALNRNEIALKEFGAQLQSISRDGWETRARVAVLEARVDANDKAIELLQADVRR